MVCSLTLCLALTLPVLAVPQTQEQEPAEDSVGWAELEARIRGGSLTAQAMSENIAGIESMDYDRMYEDLRKQINEIGKAQRMLIMSGDSTGFQELAQAYTVLRESFDAVKDGDLQEDNADVVWRLQDANNQLAAAGGSLYLSILGMEQSAADGARGLAALDRTLAGMRLRQELGQISQQAVEDLEQTRANTVSQLQTLNYTISTCKGQLQSMMGETPTGILTLEALPEEDLAFEAVPPYDEALSAARSKSWNLRNAQITLEEARDAWARDSSRYSPHHYQHKIAEHTWAAAQLTYEEAVQSFETAFHTLYNAPDDCRQILENKEKAVRHQEQMTERIAARRELGLIPQTELLAAQDELDAARSEAESTRRDLFAARNSLRLAIQYGLV